MKSLLELEKESEKLSDELILYKKGLEKLKSDEIQLVSIIEKTERSLYEKNIVLCHIREIFRIAKFQFSRLRGKTEQTLTGADVQELNKWIGRVKTEGGLSDIKAALSELDKFYPADIKSNLYALVQKIISGGAYNQSPK